MRIKKISPVTPANGNIENQYGTSQTNAYSEKYINDRFDGTKTTGDMVVNSIKTKNLFDKYHGEDGYLTSSGNVVSNPDHIVSDYIDIDGISNITISGSQGSGLENCFYNSSKTVIGHFSISSASTTQEVPSGTKYIRLTVKKTALDTYQLEGGSTATNYTSYFDSNNIGQMKVGNSTKWDGTTNDLATENNVDTWIPVMNGDKLQHTTVPSIVSRGTSDTGWIYMTDFEPNCGTYNWDPLKIRKIGNVCYLQGALTYPAGTTWATKVATMPSQFAPDAEIDIISRGFDWSSYHTIAVGNNGDISFLQTDQGSTTPTNCGCLISHSWIV